MTAVLSQPWVETWQGWNELDADGSEAMAQKVANVPVKMITNTRRFEELAAQGLTLKVASGHGV